MLSDSLSHRIFDGWQIPNVDQPQFGQPIMQSSSRNHDKNSKSCICRLILVRYLARIDKTPTTITRISFSAMPFLAEKFINCLRFTNNGCVGARSICVQFVILPFGIFALIESHLSNEDAGAMSDDVTLNLIGQFVSYADWPFRLHVDWMDVNNQRHGHEKDWRRVDHWTPETFD